MRLSARYRVLKPLGAGGAGGVFLVEDRIAGGAPIALKRIGASSDELIRESFAREFQVLATLSVPGVQRVIDFGLAEGDAADPGGPFFTRAFVDGEPLDRAATTKGPRELVAWVQAICAVVAPLHRVGLVHGDLKPSNVIVDGVGAVHVIDFGLASWASDRAKGGATGGTFAFLAPELLDGQPATPRSDVYALGATLWVLLVGRPPEQVPLTIPKRIEGEARAALEVATRALTADPARRLPTVGELADALSAALPGLTRPRAVGFVAPRPRGHENVIASLDGRVGARVGPTPLGDPILSLSGREGSGKSTVLRELKWRLQLRGVRVLDVAVRRGDAVAPLVTLVRQALVLAGDDDLARVSGERLLEALSGRTRPARAALASVPPPTADDPGPESIARVVGAVVRRGPTAILVDDVDEAEKALAAALRCIAHGGDGADRVAVVVTSSETNATVRELGPHTAVEVTDLREADAVAVVRDALGATEETVIRALVTRAGGNPGALIELLASLGEKGAAATATDVERLPSPSGPLATARARIELASPVARKVAAAVAITGAPLSWDVATTLATTFAEAAARRDKSAAGSGALRGPWALAAAEQAGLLRRVGDAVAPADDAMVTALLDPSGDGAQLPDIAALTLAVLSRSRGVASWALVETALRARDRSTVRASWQEAGAELVRTGAPNAAARIYRQSADLLGSRGDDSIREDVIDAARARLQLSSALTAAGDFDAAVEAARGAGASAAGDTELRVRALVAEGQALTQAGRFSDAADVLSSVPASAGKPERASALRALAKVQMRKGDYVAAAAAVEQGLALVDADDPARVELLTTSGMIDAYRGDSRRAIQRYESAIALARQVGTRRDEAHALAYLAIAHHRAGELARARDLYAQSLAIARELGDTGSMATFHLNLGAVSFSLGEPAAALEHYETAARLARRAGKASTDVLARSNLANVHIYLGLYERARKEAEGALRDAEGSGLKTAAAQAVSLVGDLLARTRDTDGALRRFDDAISRYHTLGQRREVAEVTLDAAEALLDRGAPSDVAAAGARLAEAAAITEQDALEDFRPRLRYLQSRARGATGDPDGAVTELDDILRDARARGDRELEWQCLAAAGILHAARGAAFLARRHEQMAVEVLEAIATGLPREHREAFWQDPRRQEVRARAHAVLEPSRSTHGPTWSATGGTLDPRARRLLEIIKRLAGEHDTDRLLERITDGAIELCGAERGFVLLVGEDGNLQTHTARDRERQDDPHRAFSRSIAEVVLIDGEPIVTTNALGDDRLREYVSVHVLQLQSVACLPIRARGRVLGVLYLENRLRRGRFGDEDIELLTAFADQAAIALDLARLVGELELRHRDLETQSKELERAKDEIERLLATRTAELEETRRDLSRAREALSDRYDTHGIVGVGPAMRRVLTLVERVRDTDIPVVIHGESGTGKELVARAIHHGGTRGKGPFVAVNCAAIPEHLLESELFGHVRGAFTGAERDRRGLVSQANGGTLFLDEVGDMPPKMQVDLLRILQERRVRPVGSDTDEEIDARVIAASNKSLRDLVSSGQFREDLFYRLNVVELQLPPLRDRPEDIPVLVDHFLRAFAKRFGTTQKQVTREAMRRLTSAPLPGNVRQLEHVLLNAWILGQGDTIEADDLPLDDGRRPTHSEMPPPARPAERAERDDDDEADDDDDERDSPAGDRPLPSNRDEYRVEEKRRILQALERCGWNRVRAARSMGMARRTFYRRLAEYGIQ